MSQLPDLRQLPVLRQLPDPHPDLHRWIDGLFWVWGPIQAGRVAGGSVRLGAQVDRCAGARFHTRVW